jgi:pyruvate,water dikinase
MPKFLDMFRLGRFSGRDAVAKTLFQKKYRHFQNLLAGNNHALEIMTDLEQLCYGPKPFTEEDLVRPAERLISQVYDIVEDLNALSGSKYPELFDSVEQTGVSVLQDLVRKKTIEKTSLTLSLQYLSLEHVSEVGGKAASIGEICNRVHLPVPLGFAVTAYACYRFMQANGLYETSRAILSGLDIDDTEKLMQCSGQIRAEILEASVPPELETAILEETDRLIEEFGPHISFAVRSSATSEDSEASFAGQHSSVLGATRENLVQAYKEVVASTFNPRAIYYRRSRGFPDDYVIMSVLCLSMVRAKTSGVMYTRDPNDPGRNVIMVNAVWGLGVGAVDGSVEADYYEIDKSDRTILTTGIGDKKVMVALADSGGIERIDVPEPLRAQPCLDPHQLMTLVDYALTLEEHYGTPLDIEWAMRRQGKLVILQARPLNLSLAHVRTGVLSQDIDVESAQKRFPGNPILLHSGNTASRGKASGLAYVLTSDHNLLNIPEGSILIAPASSPRYVPILGRVQAIVTNVGSVTGHMASVAREFGVPALVGTGNATAVISHGEEITVDATNQLIFKGRVDAILERRKPVNPMKGSPTFKAAHAALKKIAVLNLLDPQSEDFSPRGCRTLHDIIRFAHEMSMREMFRISDDIEMSTRSVVSIDVPLPMRLLAVDLGGGLKIASNKSVARAENVASVPFQALLRGMMHPDVRWYGPVGVSFKGFASIVAESMLHDPLSDKRMGGPTYVVLSDSYLNFNSRLGYHFAVLDAYCGSRVNDNYVAFSFKGGAADIGRRSRRALLIANVLKRLGLKIQIKGDMVQGEIKKYDCALMEEKLDMIGRLLGAVRLLDMMLSDEGQISWYVDQFFEGNYSFQR